MTSVVEINGPFHGDDWRAESVALVVRPTPDAPNGPAWHTGGKEPLQVATTRYPAGHAVRPHRHPPRFRPACNGQTREVIVMRAGRLLCHFWDSLGRYAGQWTLAAGEVLILLGGGHSFEALENVDLVEIKQGPFAEGDKVLLDVQRPEGVQHGA